MTYVAFSAHFGQILKTSQIATNSKSELWGLKPARAESLEPQMYIIPLIN